MRSMAHVETIEKLSPIVGADAIECATVLGWEVVVKKNEFKVGEKILYLEIDSWVPVTIAPFLQKNTVRTFNGVEGERLKTIRLRGQLSQGLILPLPDDLKQYENGHDLTESFNVQKWEMPLNPSLAGFTRGNFPGQLKKTDQDRIQNVYRTIENKVRSGEIPDEWIVQEKLEGCSMQVARVGEDIHVCSRNLSLKLDQEGNTYIDTAKKNKLIELMENISNVGSTISLQGEMIGPGLPNSSGAKNNIYKLKDFQFRLFDIYKDGRFLTISEVQDFLQVVNDMGYAIDMVPMQKGVVKGLFAEGRTVKDILDSAEIFSALKPDQLAEGLVFKNAFNPNITFKAVSNKYLLKLGD